VAGLILGALIYREIFLEKHGISTIVNQQKVVRRDLKVVARESQHSFGEIFVY
jgi:hypothetical protein